MSADSREKILRAYRYVRAALVGTAVAASAFALSSTTADAKTHHRLLHNHSHTGKTYRTKASRMGHRVHGTHRNYRAAAGSHSNALPVHLVPLDNGVEIAEGESKDGNIVYFVTNKASGDVLHVNNPTTQWATYDRVTGEVNASFREGPLTGTIKGPVNNPRIHVNGHKGPISSELDDKLEEFEAHMKIYLDEVIGAFNKPQPTEPAQASTPQGAPMTLSPASDIAAVDSSPFALPRGLSHFDTSNIFQFDGKWPKFQNISITQFPASQPLTEVPGWLQWTQPYQISFGEQAGNVAKGASAIDAQTRTLVQKVGFLSESITDPVRNSDQSSYLNTFIALGLGGLGISIFFGGLALWRRWNEKLNENALNDQQWEQPETPQDDKANVGSCDDLDARAEQAIAETSTAIPVDASSTIDQMLGYARPTHVACENLEEEAARQTAVTPTVAERQAVAEEFAAMCAAIAEDRIADANNNTLIKKDADLLVWKKFGDKIRKNDCISDIRALDKKAPSPKVVKFPRLRSTQNANRQASNALRSLRELEQMLTQAGVDSVSHENSSISSHLTADQIGAGALGAIDQALAPELTHGNNSQETAGQTHPFAASTREDIPASPEALGPPSDFVREVFAEVADRRMTPSRSLTRIFGTRAASFFSL